jgi:hypothetical protein
LTKVLQIVTLCVIIPFLTMGFIFGIFGSKAKVTDIKGHTYDVASLRLLKGSKLNVVCGGTRMAVPFRSVVSMKIDPAQIAPVDGRPHFGVEIHVRDGSVIGDIGERGRCLVCADNGLRGKRAKAAYSAPFSSLSSIEILGKDARAQRGDDDEDDDEY